MSTLELGSENNTIMVVDVNSAKWTVKEVIAWCVSSLSIQADNMLCQNLLEHDITGDLLNELTLEDCKELCAGEDRNLALKLKVLLNKLRDNESNNYSKLQQQQQENMIVSLQNLYTTLSVKLQDFQSQYTRLRMDVLDVVKSTTSSPTQSNYQITSQNSPGTFSTTQGYSHSTISNTDLSHPNNNYSHQVYYSNNGSASSSSNNLKRTSSKLVRNPTINRSTSSNSFTEPKSSTVEKTNDPSVSEPLKQLRASKEDSCERILKNAMKRHNLNEEEWRQYVLVICYGDQENVLELDEKPVVIFKNLKQQGLHPSIMLRHRGDFEELDINGSQSQNVTPGGRL